MLLVAHSHAVLQRSVLLYCLPAARKAVAAGLLRCPAVVTDGPAMHDLFTPGAPRKSWQHQRGLQACSEVVTNGSRMKCFKA